MKWNKFTVMSQETSQLAQSKAEKLGNHQFQKEESARSKGGSSPGIK